MCLSVLRILDCFETEEYKIPEDQRKEATDLIEDILLLVSFVN